MGRAIFESFELRVDGQLAQDWDDALSRLGLGQKFVGHLKHKTFRSDYTMVEGTSEYLVRLDGKASNYAALQDKFETALERLDIRITYKSMYEERYTLQWSGRK